MPADNRYKQYKRVTLLLSPESMEVINAHRSKIPGKAGLSRFVERAITDHYDPANDPCSPTYGNQNNSGDTSQK
jgi:hypothetical protein